jgi:hypothetical protein
VDLLRESEPTPLKTSRSRVRRLQLRRRGTVTVTEPNNIPPVTLCSYRTNYKLEVNMRHITLPTQIECILLLAVATSAGFAKDETVRRLGKAATVLSNMEKATGSDRTRSPARTASPSSQGLSGAPGVVTPWEGTVPLQAQLSRRSWSYRLIT